MKSLLLCSLIVSCMSASINDDIDNDNDNDVILIVNQSPTNGQVFDPVTGASVEPQNFGYNGKALQATSSCNHKLYISDEHSITIWDAVTNQTGQFSDVLQRVRLLHSMDSVNNGTHLLLCGGSLASRSCELCSVSSKQNVSCVLVSDMPYNRIEHTSVTVTDNRVLIIGGHEDDGHVTRLVWSYDTQLDAWDVTIPQMIQARDGFPGASMLDSHRLLVCGGRNWQSAAMDSCELLDLNAQRLGWHMIQSMHQARHSFALVLLRDERVYAVGGFVDVSYESTNSVEVLTNTLNWTYSLFNLTDQNMFTSTATALHGY